MHMRLRDKTACGLDLHSVDDACYDARECTCEDCKQTESYKVYMGTLYTRCPRCGDKEMISMGTDIRCATCFLRTGEVK